MSERRRLSPWLLAGATALTPAAAAEQAASGAPISIAAPAPPAPAAPTARLTVGEQADFTRLSFDFSGAATVTPILAGDQLDLRFSRAADLDLAEARANLPKLVRAISRVSRPGQPLRLALTLDPGVRQRHFVDGGHVVVDLLAPPAPAAVVLPDGTTASLPAAPEGPPPPHGTGALRVVDGAESTQITVRWPSAARAAAFRRGEAFFILFEANGEIDLRGVARVGRRYGDLEPVRGEGVVGLRIPVQPDVQLSAHADGASWVFTLGSRSDEGADAPVRIDPTKGGRLIADFHRRDGVVRQITDPEIGDRVIVALLRGPEIGVDMRRSTLEAAVLPSAHGAVIEPRADGVGAIFEGGDLVISRAAGLLMNAAQPGATRLDAAALETALITTGADGAATSLSNRQIRAHIDDLTRRAAAEGTAPGAPNSG
ncbi:MAG: hypothetical protein AB7L65_10285, partial [Hyphomonadaceae bacterium]